VTYNTLKFQNEGEIATITLARPEKRNAISMKMIEELIAALDEADAGTARVVIITGEGKAFCAGMDLEGLRSIAEQSRGENFEDSRRMAAMFYRIYSFRKPVITAVNGAAIAGGCGIATLADFTLAVPEAQFGYTEVKIGFMPALVSVFLRRQIGEKHSRDLLLSGRILNATEAFRIGLVTEIVAAEKLLERAREIAGKLLEASPVSLARTKLMLLRADESALKAEIETAVKENADIRRTADFQEGLSAFLEKRRPKWLGR
jgi:methylglutaconyl-CoA hydratase